MKKAVAGRSSAHLSVRIDPVIQPMAAAAMYSLTLAVVARQLQDAGCPCPTSAPSGTSYPTFTLAGERRPPTTTVRGVSCE